MGPGSISLSDPSIKMITRVREQEILWNFIHTFINIVRVPDLYKFEIMLIQNIYC